jgi:hypothetical protein
MIRKLAYRANIDYIPARRIRRPAAAAIWGRFPPGQRQRNTSEPSSSTNGINAQSNRRTMPTVANAARTPK